MQDLRLVGTSEDGYLILAALNEQLGEERFRLRIDEDVRTELRYAALRSTPGAGRASAPTGPREIQARIRAGESAEEVANAAGVPLEKVRRYEGPVLAERQHIAYTAQQCPVRRPSSERAGPGGRSEPLGEAVAARLGSRGVDREVVEWDAWRREDGRWTVRVGYPSGCARQHADFAYDPASRISVPRDEHARWLLGEEPAEASRSFVPRLAAVGDMVGDMVGHTVGHTVGHVVGAADGGAAGTGRGDGAQDADRTDRTDRTDRDEDSAAAVDLVAREAIATGTTGLPEMLPPAPSRTGAGAVDSGRGATAMAAPAPATSGSLAGSVAQSVAGSVAGAVGEVVSGLVGSLGGAATGGSTAELTSREAADVRAEGENAMDAREDGSAEPPAAPREAREGRPPSPPPAPGARAGRRASVPAWDDILFGVKRSE